MEAVRSKGQGFPENSTVVMSKVAPEQRRRDLLPAKRRCEPAQSPAREQETDGSSAVQPRHRTRARCSADRTEPQCAFPVGRCLMAYRMPDVFEHRRETAVQLAHRDALFDRENARSRLPRSSRPSRHPRCSVYTRSRPRRTGISPVVKPFASASSTTCFHSGCGSIDCSFAFPIICSSICTVSHVSRHSPYVNTFHIYHLAAILRADEAGTASRGRFVRRSLANRDAAVLLARLISRRRS